MTALPLSEAGTFLAQIEALALVIAGGLLIVLGGGLLLTGRVFDRVSAALVALSGLYALLWKLPELRGFSETGNYHIQLTGAVFLFLLSSAVLVLASSRFAEQARRLALENADLQRTIALEQVHVDILGHDVINPIMVARGELELYARRQPTAPPELERAIAALDRAAGIIDDSVLYSRLVLMDSLEREPIDIASMARDVIEGLEPLAAERRVRFEVEVPEGLVAAATPLLARVLDNLVSNAVKWSPRDGTVRVAARRTGEHLRILVEDHGPGVPPEDRPHLFSRFSRADRSGVKGMGLGLAICHRIVNMLEGRIDVSETPGGGASFVVLVPLPVTPPPAALRPDRAPTRAPGTQGVDL